MYLGRRTVINSTLLLLSESPKRVELSVKQIYIALSGIRISLKPGMGEILVEIDNAC